MVSIREINFNQCWENSRNLFSRLINIPSVYDAQTASQTEPCGSAVAEALAYMRSLCEDEGFDIRDYQGHAFSASWGAGERIDIVSHLDVVAVDEGWDEDPFSGSVHDGYVHGRGTVDMKSGAFLTFLALKLLKDNGIVPKRELRLVYGTDEERTMDDMRYYVGHEGLPVFAFTPDGSFPMVNGEKGALMWTLEAPYSGSILSLHAGIQPNVIPAEASALLKAADIPSIVKIADETGMKYEISHVPEGTVITVYGKAAHASAPWLGHNATADLLRLLAVATEEESIVALAEAFSDPYGIAAGLSSGNEDNNTLTLNPGILEISAGRISAMVDCRYPYGRFSKDLTDILRNRLTNFSILLPYDDPPTFTPEDDPYIQKLKAAYTLVTGKECTCGISGGVSYSKVFGRCVTFGTVSEEECGLAHQKNEKISEKACIDALKIFYCSLLNLSEAE